MNRKICKRCGSSFYETSNGARDEDLCDGCEQSETNVRQHLKVGQFVRLTSNHERSGECGTIEEINSATARFKFHFDGVETVQPLNAFSADTLIFHGL
ncbi:hypothetical protein JS562_37640 [Agrobacterium sp. S2]|nr:hypothetical protein [Agrobacterium sp. S2]